MGASEFYAVLPERVSAVLLMNVLGHFDADDRLAVWDLLAGRLAPGGRGLLTLHPPTVPQHVPSAPVAEATIGCRRYRGHARAEPSGPDTVDWEMSYQDDEQRRAPVGGDDDGGTGQILDGDTTITEFSARDRWVVVTAEQIAAELEPQGLPARAPSGLSSDSTTWPHGVSRPFRRSSAPGTIRARSTTP